MVTYGITSDDCHSSSRGYVVFQAMSDDQMLKSSTSLDSLLNFTGPFGLNVSIMAGHHHEPSNTSMIELVNSSSVSPGYGASHSNDLIALPDHHGSTLQTEIILFIMYGSLAFTAIASNLIICYIVLSTQKMRTATNYFILNLALGDILVALLCIPFTVLANFVFQYWPFGRYLCVIVSYAQANSVFISAYTMVAISIDKYLAIIYPMRLRMTKLQAKIIIIVIWSAAFMTSLPTALFSKLTVDLSPAPTPASSPTSSPGPILTPFQNSTYSYLSTESDFETATATSSHHRSTDIVDQITSTIASSGAPPVTTKASDDSFNHERAGPSSTTNPSGSTFTEVPSSGNNLDSQSLPDTRHYFCQEDWPDPWPQGKYYYGMALMILQFVVPLFVLVITYTRIVIIVWGKKMPGEEDNARDARMARSKRKMIKMVILCVIAFALTWLPFNVLMVVGDLYPNVWELENIRLIFIVTHYLAMCHTITNPVIYIWMNNTFRSGFRQVVCELLWYNIKRPMAFVCCYCCCLGCLFDCSSRKYKQICADHHRRHHAKLNSLYGHQSHTNTLNRLPSSHSHCENHGHSQSGEHPNHNHNQNINSASEPNSTTATTRHLGRQVVECKQCCPSSRFRPTPTTSVGSDIELQPLDHPTEVAHVKSHKRQTHKPSHAINIELTTRQYYYGNNTKAPEIVAPTQAQGEPLNRPLSGFQAVVISPGTRGKRASAKDGLSSRARSEDSSSQSVSVATNMTSVMLDDSPLRGPSTRSIRFERRRKWPYLDQFWSSTKLLAIADKCSRNATTCSQRQASLGDKANHHRRGHLHNNHDEDDDEDGQVIVEVKSCPVEMLAADLPSWSAAILPVRVDDQNKNSQGLDTSHNSSLAIASNSDEMTHHNRLLIPCKDINNISNINNNNTYTDSHTNANANCDTYTKRKDSSDDTSNKDVVVAESKVKQNIRHDLTHHHLDVTGMTQPTEVEHEHDRDHEQEIHAKKSRHDFHGHSSLQLRFDWPDETSLKPDCGDKQRQQQRSAPALDLDTGNDDPEDDYGNHPNLLHHLNSNHDRRSHALNHDHSPETHLAKHGHRKRRRASGVAAAGEAGVAIDLGPQTDHNAPKVAQSLAFA